MSSCNKRLWYNKSKMWRKLSTFFNFVHHKIDRYLSNQYYSLRLIHIIKYHIWNHFSTCTCISNSVKRLENLIYLIKWNKWYGVRNELVITLSFGRTDGGRFLGTVRSACFDSVSFSGKTLPKIFERESTSFLALFKPSRVWVLFGWFFSVREKARNW